MTRWGRQRIESYEFLNDVRATVCYVCEEANCFGKDSCRHCGAPLALTFQSAGKKKKPQMIGIVGAPGTGKTAYLGMLADILSRQQGPVQILACGAFSVGLQQATLDALARGQFPARTAPEPRDWNWLHCEMGRREAGKRKARQQPDLILPDISGTALLSELEDPGSVRIIRAFLSKCAAAMLLVDADRLQSGDADPDLMTARILDYLAELAPDRRRGWRKRPVAIVFTKADRCQSCFDNPKEFGRSTTPELWKLCKKRLANHCFFANALVGSTLEYRHKGQLVQLPLRVEPRGTVQPFEWLVEKLAL